MPTMRSIGMHPPLRDRLASLGSEPPSSAPPPADDPSGCSARHHQPRQHLPIRTPQALLSRDPSQVASGLGLPLPAVLNLRAAVADAVTVSACPGGGGGGHGRAANVAVAAVSEAMGRVGREARRRRRKRRRGGGGMEVGGGIGGEDDDDDDDEAGPLFHRLRPPPAIVGAVTALDLCIHASLLAERPQSSSLSTGSARLDALLAPPPGLTDGGPATRVYHSSVVPEAAAGGGATTDGCDDGGGRAGRAAAHFGPESAPPQGGIRPGYVTEAYGPPSSGKTQLALTLAANAAVRGGWTVHYLAGGGGSGTVLPLARRLKVLCASRLSSSASPSSSSRDDSQAALVRALERVVFSTVQDGQRALAVLAWVERDALGLGASPPPPDGDGDGDGATADANHASPGKGLADNSNVLIVLDSASGCLSSDLYADGDGGAGAALVNDVSLALRRMARAVGRHGARCAVFVANGTVSSSSSSGAGAPPAASSLPPTRHKPALGSGWRAADVLLHLDAVGDDDCCPPDGQREGAERGRRAVVPGLVTSTVRTVRATLVRHCSKSVSSRRGVDAISAEFGIAASGIVDR